jgi:hypothetical protein
MFNKKIPPLFSYFPIHISLPSVPPIFPPPPPHQLMESFSYHVCRPRLPLSMWALHICTLTNILYSVQPVGSTLLYSIFLLVTDPVFLSTAYFYYCNCYYYYSYGRTDRFCSQTSNHAGFELFIDISQSYYLFKFSTF